MKTNIEIIREYEKKRNKREVEKERLLLNIYSKHPELKRIDQEMNALTIKNMIKNNKENNKDIKEKNDSILKKELEKLEKERLKYLKANKLKKEDFEVKYDCNICNDTGFVSRNGNRYKCNCYIQKIIDENYKSSNLNINDRKTFDNFSLDYYSKEEKNGESAYSKAKKALEYSKKYVETFEQNKNFSKPGIIMIGGTGLGKTHLTEAIGTSLLNKNKTVFYQTATNLFSKIIEYKFNDYIKYNELSDYLNGLDLLILDDLGVENLNKAREEEFFTIINDRLQKNKPIIITTNLTPAELNKRYSKRIFSRLVEKSKFFNFEGEDIRMIKAKKQKLEEKEMSEK